MKRTLQATRELLSTSRHCLSGSAFALRAAPVKGHNCEPHAYHRSSQSSHLATAGVAANMVHMRQSERQDLYQGAEPTGAPPFQQGISHTLHENDNAVQRGMEPLLQSISDDNLVCPPEVWGRGQLVSGRQNPSFQDSLHSSPDTAE